MGNFEAPGSSGALAFPLRATFRAGGFVARELMAARTPPSTRSTELVERNCPRVVDAHVDSLGRSRGVVVDERRTTLWMSLGKARSHVADLRKRHPLVVDDNFFGATFHRFVSTGGYRAQEMTTIPDLQDELPFGAPARSPAVAVEPLVEVRRSARRRRTVSAYRDGDRTVVLVPARMSRAEEQRWVATMLAQLAAREAKSRPSDEQLFERAQSLSARYLQGKAQPASVRWVDNQQSRWGSCTPMDRTIRLSRRLMETPGWVLDYVLLHELAHLLEPGHGAQFWALLEAYPRTERARGYLEGFAAAEEIAG